MPRFVVHEHHSRRLHWDLRLEIGNALKSWAVPKQPPLQKGIKRLAVQVEDHALSYINFEGVIKEGYGKGTVKIWDKGSYEIENEKPHKIVLVLRGKKLKGGYVLLKFKTKERAKNHWLLFKR